MKFSRIKAAIVSIPTKACYTLEQADNVKAKTVLGLNKATDRIGKYRTIRSFVTQSMLTICPQGPIPSHGSGL